MNDLYYMLVVNPSSHKELFSDFLIDAIPVGFEETEEGFIIRSEEDLETISWGIEQFAQALGRALHEEIDVELILTKEKNEDWIHTYQQAIRPVWIEPFYIHPTWEAPKEGALNIALDPALAFGTGHHATTASCLRAMARYLQPGQTLLDVGCGSGILAIAGMALGARVDACDTDPLSVENARLNAVQNGVEYAHVWEGSIQKSTQTYDMIVANIVADVLAFIARDFRAHVRVGGMLILSGIMDKYEAKVLHAYRHLSLTERIQEEEWVTLVLTYEGE